MNRKEDRVGDLKDEGQREEQTKKITEAEGAGEENSSQQRRAGTRGWSSREFAAGKKRYLDRDVERRLRKQLQHERER